jgi:transcriptional regulator with XRE-family HTH domain
MAHNFAELETKMSAEAIAPFRRALSGNGCGDALHELRRARGISKEMLAKALSIKQPNVAKLEKRTDIYISTLRATIEAMGGTLDIVARFPDGTVKITNFSSIGESETTTS